MYNISIVHTSSTSQKKNAWNRFGKLIKMSVRSYIMLDQYETAREGKIYSIFLLKVNINRFFIFLVS